MNDCYNSIENAKEKFNDLNDYYNSEEEFHNEMEIFLKFTNLS